MPSCELCGKDADSLTKVKIEGAKLKACDTCKDMGEEVEDKSSSSNQTRRKKKKKSRTSKRTGSNKVLVNDYGDRVKSAREDETLSISELADEMNVKSSVLKKIEREEFKPDKSLAKTLSKRLGVDLYTNPEAYEVDDSSGDNRDATLGDVANIKD